MKNLLNQNIESDSIGNRKKYMAIDLDYQIILNSTLETTSSKKLLANAINL